MSDTTNTAQTTAVPALQVDNVSFHYGDRKALDSISLDITSGEAVILLGPNGAGKSTLFSLICGLFSPKNGTIEIQGLSVGSTSAALQSLGIVFQSQTLDADLSIAQNLHYYCALQGIQKNEATSRIDHALSHFDLQERAHEKIRSLNGGHRRRVEIARATLHQPTLLLLDEPTVGLDIPTRTELIERLHKLPQQSNCALLWATHLIDEVAPSDRVIVLHQGQIHANGICGDLLTEYGADDIGDVMNQILQSTKDAQSESKP